jgi:hypothetical protein
MWRFATFRRLLPARTGLAVVLAALIGITPAAAQRFYPDPAEGLRAALKLEPSGREQIAERNRRVRMYATALRSIGDLARALRFPDWRASDQGLREQIALRLVREIGRAIHAPQTLTRRAVAEMIGEFGRSVAGVETADRGNLTQQLAEDLELLTRKNQPNAVRAAAARSLGRIDAGPRERWVMGDPDASLYEWMKSNFPDIAPLLVRDANARLEVVPSLAVGTLRGLLVGPNDAAIREAAARGLLGLIRSIPLVQRVGTTYSAVETLATCREVIPVAGIGLRDADPTVRRLCARTLQQVAEVLKVPLPSPAFYALSRSQMEKIPEYRSADDERKDEIYNAISDRAETNGRALRDQLHDSLIVRLARQGQALATLLRDQNARVRLQTRRTLIEIVGVWRQQRQGMAEALPPPTPKRAPRARPPRGVHGSTTRLNAALASRRVYVARKEDHPPLDQLLDGLNPAVRDLARGITDRYSKIRLDSLEFLEMLVRAGAPPHPEVVPALIQALSDPDRFVRWAAARTLGWYSREKPADPDRAVPALAKLLDDDDPDVRTIGALALQVYGPTANGAVDALIKAVQRGDPEVRKEMMGTLVTIGKPARKAIPTLTGLLTNPEPAVRQDAAKTLGQFGPAAKSAIPALRKLLNDSDRAIRQAASEAIVNITVAAKE